MKIFHGWRVVGAGALLQVLQGGLMQQSFGAYVAVLPSEPGWSKTALSGGAALMSLATALLGAGATLAHLLLRLLGGGRGGLAATVRTVAYVGGAISLSAALPAFSCLSPYLLFGYLWVALAAAHGDPIWRPMAALAATALLAACAAGVFLAFALSPFFRPLG